jgi:hypothetical protein
VAPVEIYNPLVAADRAALVAAVAAAGEMATALPSVDLRGGGANSVSAILADGLLRKLATGGPPAVVYTAENHTHAARLLARRCWPDAARRPAAVRLAACSFWTRSSAR